VLIAGAVLSGSAPAASLEDTLKGALNSRSKASTPGSLTQSDAAGGIKEALAKGVETAINQLGKPDGYFKDQAVKILVPKKVRKVADLARQLGAGSQVEAFELSMNRAAEKAVPSAANVLGDAVRGMTMDDAIGLVRGGDTAATDFFKRTSEEKLYNAFLPIVSKQTAATGVTQRYKSLTGSVSNNALGSTLLGSSTKAGDLDGYVTDKAIDGLFAVIAQQEQDIRSNPAARTTGLLKKVFGN
jgi:hypothetical protein